MSKSRLARCQRKSRTRMSILDMHTLSLSFRVRLETSRRCSWAWVCFRTAVVARESARYELVVVQKLEKKVLIAVLIPTWKEKKSFSDSARPWWSLVLPLCLRRSHTSQAACLGHEDDHVHGVGRLVLCPCLRLRPAGRCLRH
jgi:hypothetical protein